MKTIYRLYDLRTDEVVEEFEPWLKITTLEDAITEIGGKPLLDDNIGKRFLLDDEVCYYDDFSFEEEKV